jgi:hypothetical protein
LARLKLTGSAEVEVEVEVERRSDSSDLSLDLSLNLPESWRTFSASCRPRYLSLISNLGTLGSLNGRAANRKEDDIVKQTRGRLGVGIVLTASLLMGVGCGGTGKTFYLDLQQKQAAAQYMEPESVRIIIEPFEDRRLEKNRLGLRTHLWGGVTYFNVAGERPGDVIAQALVDRLKTRGWKDRAWTVRVASSGAVTNLNDADIVISGQLLDFSANAKSRLFSTVVNTSSKMVITARNIGNQSSTTRNVEGAERDTVVWFSEDDVQQLLATTLKDSIDRYLADTTIEHKALRSVR